MSLTQTSSKYLNEHNFRFNNEPQLRVLLEERTQLPVHAYRHQILDSVYSKQITLIRGETGCGKTTQVNFKSLKNLFFKLDVSVKI